MKFLHNSFSRLFVCFAGVVVTITTSGHAEQTVFSSGAHDAVGAILELSAISHNQFTTFSHSAFPGQSTRIKKSDFCDGGVISYTGYIDVGPRHFFFYFFESRSDPENDDVILWTNGGPCNVISPNSTEYNPYSWNSNANIFFIDQPIGTGFSYHDYGELLSTAEDAAEEMAAFVAMFFETFSNFRGCNFHLAGESYGGRVLPIYAAAIYDLNAVLAANSLTPIKLKSIMLGNGWTDVFHVFRSYYVMQCTNASLGPVQTINTCVRMKQILPRCESRLRTNCIEHFDRIDCMSSSNFCRVELFDPLLALGYDYHDISRKCDTDVDCYPEHQDIEAYLNSPSTRMELGVDPAFGRFNLMNPKLSVSFWRNGDQLHETKLYVAELLARGVKVLVYAGSYDFICNWIGNERWTLEMEWAGKEAFSTTPLRDWLVGDEPAGKTRASGNLTFATIQGAGHMAPHDKPIESLEMLKRWLADEAM
ncbi:hypothetical protein EW145_g6648 [Phellinidium pouzarii]|uniref:Carboxypeptidase n=1 Tax=Phellinidium pouzarii TaxID=167371 RepID=A0A4S4KW29_9AGAM|nr:hypothetical protein EW145_g6648 [Phellinidium pouzarii]